jgi:hypothetical protein
MHTPNGHNRLLGILAQPPGGPADAPPALRARFQSAAYLSAAEEDVLDAVRAEPGLSVEQIYDRVNPTPDAEVNSLLTVGCCLARLRALGLIRNPGLRAGYHPWGG